jgi:hypothetical protein
VPVIVTAVPPVSGPALGEMPPTVGAGCCAVIPTLLLTAGEAVASVTVSVAVKLPGRL